MFEIDCDLNAAVNILMRGLNHSICPYKFYCKGDFKPNENEMDFIHFVLTFYHIAIVSLKYLPVLFLIPSA